MKQKPRYSVETCFPGCLPEGDEPILFNTIREAQAFAREEANAYRESGMYVTGNAREGYYVQRDKDSVGGFSLYVVDMEIWGDQPT